MMTTDVYQYQLSASKATIPPEDHRLHQARLETYKESVHGRYIRRQSVPSGVVHASKFYTNIPQRQFSPVAINRSRSPSKYTSLKRVEVNSRILGLKSFDVRAKAAEDKPNIFNPEPVPFAAEKLRCSTVLKKVPLARQLKDGIPCGVYCSPTLLCRTKGFVIRPGRQQLNVSDIPMNSAMSSESKAKEERTPNFQVLPTKFKAPFFHASRALFTDPPGSYAAIGYEDSSPYGDESADKPLEVSLVEETREQRTLPPLNETDDSLTVDVALLTTHEGTSIYWPPPPPPVSTDVTMISSYPG